MPRSTGRLKAFLAGAACCTRWMPSLPPRMGPIPLITAGYSADPGKTLGRLSGRLRELFDEPPRLARAGIPRERDLCEPQPGGGVGRAAPPLVLGRLDEAAAQVELS